MTKTLIGASALAVMLSAGVALAQTQTPPTNPTYVPSSSGTYNAANPTINTSGSTTNMNPSTGAPTSQQYGPSNIGAPNTGAGGSAAQNAAILGVSAAIFAVGLLALRKRRSA